MVAVTYGVARNAASAEQNVSKPKGWFVRFMEALIESRMRSAEREIAMHRHLTGWHSESAAVEKKDLPFAR